MVKHLFVIQKFKVQIFITNFTEGFINILMSPLKQFSIYPIVRYYNNYIDLSISNLTILIIFIMLFIIIIMNINNNVFLNNKEKLFSDLSFLIEEIIKDNNKINKYTPIIITNFIILIIGNLIGLIPYNLTITSQFIINMFFSLNLIITVSLIGLIRYKLKFLYKFIPESINKGKTKILIPVIFFIELISYLSRIISLSARLTINIIAGHVLLKIIINFFNMLIMKYFIISPLLIILIIPLFLLEIGVACIQTYIFILLTFNYLKDTL